MFKSPRGLYDFQAEGVALCYLRPNNLVVWDQGLGKSILAMALSDLLFEDDQIDRVLLIAKKNKLEEWLEDFGTFTDLSAALYHGPKRKKLLEEPPQVLITTYETARNDAVEKIRVEGRKSLKLVPGGLLRALEGQRVLVVYDEFVKLANRSSALFKSQELLLKELRPDCRVLSLTATPLTRSPENFYNLGRLLLPGYLNVTDFERDYVASYDFRGNPRAWKNLEPDDCAPTVVSLAERLSEVIIRKRKTDPDVVEQFPQATEEFTFVDLHPDQREFYDMVREIFKETDGGKLSIALRQIAAYPAALLHSESEIAKQIVEVVGEEGLLALPSAKTEALIEYLEPLVEGQGEQVVVFTFFGPSVIPFLKQRISERIDAPVAVYYGGIADREEQKAMFKRGEARILLASDAGADGINLPEASYAIEYDIASTHATRMQRLNRISRIGQGHSIIHYQTFIAKDTVEEKAVDNVLLRNEWSDKLYEGLWAEDAEAEFIKAEERRELVEQARLK